MTPAAPAPVEAPNDYPIGPQDLLKIEVFGVEGLNRSVRQFLRSDRFAPGRFGAGRGPDR